MKLNNIKRTFLASAALLTTISMSAADRFVNFKQGDLLLNANNRVEIYMDTNDCKGVSYAAHALLKDIKSVSGATATLTSDAGFLKFVGGLRALATAAFYLVIFSNGDTSQQNTSKTGINAP